MAKYEYQPPLLLTFLVITFFGVCSWIMGCLAFTNDTGLIIYKIIELSSDQADIVYWAVSGVFAIIVVLCFFLIVQRLKDGKKYLEIHEEYFFIPKHGFVPEKKVLFKDIKSVTKESFRGTIIYTFITNDDQAGVMSGNFKSKKEFKEAIELLKNYLSRYEK